MDYRLQKIEIEFARWGENKGKYVGKVQFENGDSEQFSFNVTPEMSQDFLNLCSKQIVTAANQLGDKLLQSLNLIPVQAVQQLTDKT